MQIIDSFSVYSYLRGKIIVKICKGKMRVVILPKDLCKMLYEYTKGQKIKSGCVFVTKTGKPLDRSNVWKMMKSLCEDAKVSKEKVYPHNLRHLLRELIIACRKTS